MEQKAEEEGGRATDTGQRDTHTIVSPNDNRSHPGGNATHPAGHSPSRPPTEAEKEPTQGGCATAMHTLMQRCRARNGMEMGNVSGRPGLHWAAPGPWPNQAPSQTRKLSPPQNSAMAPQIHPPRINHHDAKSLIRRLPPRDIDDATQNGMYVLCTACPDLRRVPRQSVLVMYCTSRQDTVPSSRDKRRPPHP